MMRRAIIRHPRFFARSHVQAWVAEVLRTARLVWGNTQEYHWTVKRVMQIKRAALTKLDGGNNG